MGWSGLSQSHPLSTPSNLRTELQNSWVSHCGKFALTLLGSQTATPCTSGSRKKRSMTRKPWAPTPMKAILTLSLGGTYPAPPSTRRGTIERPIAAAAVCAKNLRRETEADSSLCLPNPRPQMQHHYFGCCLHFAMIYHSFDRLGYCKWAEGRKLKVGMLRVTTPGGLGSVANTRVRDSRFWKCGNSKTYGRIFGSVARKGVREKEVRKYGAQR